MVSALDCYAIGLPIKSGILLLLKQTYEERQLATILAMKMLAGVASEVNLMQWRIQDVPEEGAPTPQGGAPTYDFAIFSQKLHEIERIWAPGGGARPKFYYVDPPLSWNVHHECLDQV